MQNDSAEVSNATACYLAIAERLRNRCKGRDRNHSNVVSCDLLMTAAESIERLLMERDVLGLNFGKKDPSVFVLMDGQDVASVAWNHAQSASEPAVKMPTYAR